MTSGRGQGGASLAGRRVLVVEDAYFIADDLRCLLEAHGAEVIGPVGQLTQASDLARTSEPIDAAILDIDLHGDAAYELADVLRARGVPFVFATGYSARAIPPAYAVVPRWEKPYPYETLLAALPSLMGAR